MMTAIEVCHVKNVTWIFMEIPCHFMSEINGSLAKINTKVHDYSMSFILILFVFHAQLKYDMDFGQVQFMEFPWRLLRKCDGISI